MTELILSNQLKKQFETQFLKPVNLLFETGIIQNPIAYPPYSPEAIAIKNIHRNTIINFGRGNFDTEIDKLTPIQKVELYCFYYFQMHFSSSYVFYQKETELLLSLIKNKTVFFIDIGCGPFTSGLAFNRWLTNFAENNSGEINYIGVDTSKNMLQKAQEVSKGTPHLNYKTTNFVTDKNKIFNLHQFSFRDNVESIIILNFSYLFGSNTITAPDMAQFTNELFRFHSDDKNENLPKFIVMQQNPDYEHSNDKWSDYKKKLTGLTSKSGYPQSIDFAFDDFFGSLSQQSPSFNVRCDLLKSF